MLFYFKIKKLRKNIYFSRGKLVKKIVVPHCISSSEPYRPTNQPTTIFPQNHNRHQGRSGREVERGKNTQQMSLHCED